MLIRNIAILGGLLVITGAAAGPLEGDLFGYRLGSKYQVGAGTRGHFSFMGQVVLLAEKAELPAGFARVELIASPKTFTIINVYALAVFDDEGHAKEFEAKYADLLNTMYRDKCALMKAYLEEALKLRCASAYELSVHRFKPHNSGEKHTVHVGLRFDNDSPAGKRIVSQFNSELGQLDTEAKRQRVDRALREGDLTGLK